MTTAQRVLEALQPYDLKKEGTNRYRCNSPLRPGSNSHAFTLVIEGDEHGAYNDFVSGESGSLYDLAQALKIALPDRVPVTTTKRAYSGLADYARAHGLQPEVLKAAKWGETMKYCAAHKKERHALVFVTRTGNRWRFLDGLKPHYISPQGYQRCWYGLTASTLRQVADGKPLVVCNGEISTVAAAHHGVAAACVTAGESVIPPDLIEELKAALGSVKAQILVALDCDKKGQESARKITAQFKAAGLNARSVDLGLGHGGDLADFCALYRYESNDALVKLPSLPDEQVESNAHPHWRIIPASQLKNLPKVAWLVDKEIPERGLTTIYGPSGVGKSFLALDYALKIAQKKTVVYVAAEGESGYLLRVDAWTHHHTSTEGKLHFCLGSPNVMDESDLSMFIGEIASLTPAMVIVDTLAMAMIGGDENSARDMGLVIQACLRLKRELECSVVLVHHTNKAGSVERGSGALRGASDTMIKVTADDDLVIVESSKTKDAEPFPTRYMRMLPVPTPNGESRVLVDAGRVEQTVYDPLTRLQRKVLEAMSLEVFTNGATLADLSEMTETGRGSIQRVLSKLLRLGYVDQPQKGDSYVISQVGLSSLKRLGDSFDSVTPAITDKEGLNNLRSQGVTESPSQQTLFGVSESVPNQYTGGL